MKNSRKFFHRVLALLVLGLAWGNAQALLIDDFSSPLLAGLTVSVVGQVATTTQNPASALGGTRTIEIEKLAGPLSSTVAIIDLDGVPGPPVTGALDIANDVVDRSAVTISWGFGTIGAQDFTDSGNSTGLFLGLPNPIDKQMDVTVTLEDSGGVQSTLTSMFSSGSSGPDFFLAFSDFTGSADLTSLTGASMLITSPDFALDTQISLIETRRQVPAPAPWLLLGAGLLAFGARRRRQ